MTLRLLPLTTRESERSKNREAAQSPHDIFSLKKQKTTRRQNPKYTHERERKWVRASESLELCPRMLLLLVAGTSLSLSSAAGVQEAGRELVAERRVLINWRQAPPPPPPTLPLVVLCAAACLALSSLSLVPACPPPATARAALDGETKALSYTYL